jgi:hypothetical protein
MVWIVHAAGFVPLKVDLRASFFHDLVGLREISTVYFLPKSVVDTQYVLDSTLIFPQNDRQTIAAMTLGA